MRLQTPPGTRRRRPPPSRDPRGYHSGPTVQVVPYAAPYYTSNMYRGGSPSSPSKPPPEQQLGTRPHVFAPTCIAGLRFPKLIHNMPPRGPEPHFRLDSRSLQVDRFITSTAIPGSSEVVTAAAWPRRSAIIGLLQADLTQVHSPQSDLTHIVNRHSGNGAATTTRITTIARVEPTSWAGVATRGSAATTTRVEPTPWAHATR